MRGSRTEIKPRRRPPRWRLRVFTGRRTERGSPIFRSENFCGSAVAADERLREMIAQQQAEATRSLSGSADIETMPTVGSLFDLWFPHLESLGRSPTTLRKYHQIADADVRPTLGNVPLSSLTARDLDVLYASLRKRNLKATSIRRVHALMSSALHQAEKWRMVDQNVARLATPPPVHTEQVVAPTPAEVQELVEAANAVEPMMATILFIAALSGCRRGELCGLRWTDVDWNNGMLNVERSVFETKGGGWGLKDTKSHSVRRVTLDDIGMEVLTKHRAAVDQLAKDLGIGLRESAFIFSRSPQGLEPVRPDLVTKFVARISGGRTHLHSLRHYSATQAVAGGHDIRTVAGRLGHADASVTLRVYSHVLPERDREVATTIGRTLSPSFLK